MPLFGKASSRMKAASMPLGLSVHTLPAVHHPVPRRASTYSEVVALPPGSKSSIHRPVIPTTSVP